MQGKVLEEDIGACRRQQYVCQTALVIASVRILTRLRMHWLNSYSITVTDMSLFSRHQRQQNIVIHAERLFRGYLPP